MLKRISIIVGILVGGLAVANGMVDLVERLWLAPDQNQTMHIALINETPIFSETVEIQPNPDLAMRMDINIKIYKSGDIIIESGQTLKFLPFNMLSQHQSHTSFMSAMAVEVTQRTIDGEIYEIKEIRFVEIKQLLTDGKLEQKRIYEDGIVEIKIIDMRSNKIIETKTSTKQLTETEISEIAESRFKKKIYLLKAD